MKRISVIALLLACLLALAACQPAAPAATTPPVQKPPTAANTPAAGQATAAPAPAPEPPMKISWVPQNDAPVDMTSPGVIEFQKQMNIEIEFVYLERSQIADLLQLRIAGGDIPDVMWINGNRSMYTNFAEQGVLAEIPVDYIRDNMPVTWEETNVLCGEDNWPLLAVNGKNYGIPTPNEGGMYPFVPIIRDDWLANVGITSLPVTVEDHEKAFYSFVNDDPDGNGKNDTYALSRTGMNIVFGAYGGLPLDVGWTRKGDEALYTATMPEMLDALTLLAKWYKDGLIDPEFITGENKGQSWANTVPFWNGLIGYSSPGMWYHVNPITNPNNPNDLGSTNYQQFKAIQGEAATYKEIKPMVGPNGQSGAVKWGIGGAADLVLGVQCETDRAKFEKILSIAEMQMADFDLFLLCSRGVEGEEYERTDDPKEPFRSLLDTSDSLIGAKHGFGVAGMMMVRGSLDSLFKNSNMYQSEYRNQFTDWPSYTNFVKLQLPSDPMYGSQINTARNEGYWNFVMGQRPCTQAEWDKFIGELNALGLDTLQKEAQDYLNTYLK